MATITITDAGLNLVRNGTKGNSLKITYVALGTSTTAPTTGDMQLGAEVFRKAVTSYQDGATGQEIITLYLGSNDAVGDGIKEVGFYGGNATDTADSGDLLARGLYTHTKADTESIIFPLTFNVSRA